MKIINETLHTINKLEGRRRRKIVPGAGRLAPKLKVQRETEEENMEGLDSFTSGNGDGDAFGLLLQQELDFLMQPAASYGLDGINETFEETVQEWDHNGDNASGSSFLYEGETIQNEFRLVNHYCRVMSRFYSVKDPDWNFYSIVSNVFAYRYPPLKYSLLAWSSLHLSIQEGTPISKHYYESALSAVMKENFSESSIPIELLLATSYFLCLYDVMNSRSVSHILRHVWSTIRIGRIFEAEDKGNSKVTLTTFAYQLVTWLIYLDIRSALFIGNIHFPEYMAVESKRRQNSDVAYLTVSEVYEYQAVLHIFENARNVLSDLYGPAYPKENIAKDVTLDEILVLMVKNMLLFGTLIRLRCWLELCGNSTEFDPQSLKLKIDSLYEQCQKLEYSDDNDRLTNFHVLVIKSLTHASIIYFDRICYPDILTNDACQKAASEIIRIAIELKKLRQHKTPGSLQWPFPLFIAGLETKDVIYQNWIFEELDNCDREGWGSHIGKTKVLLNECLKKQNELGKRVDVGPIMQKVTGYFIL